jgi:hypothetical protein
MRTNAAVGIKVSRSGQAGNAAVRSTRYGRNPLFHQERFVCRARSILCCSIPLYESLRHHLIVLRPLQTKQVSSFRELSAVHAITLADIDGILVAHLEKDVAPLDGSREK